MIATSRPIFSFVKRAQVFEPSAFIFILTVEPLEYWSKSARASVTTSPSSGARPSRLVTLIAISSYTGCFASGSIALTDHTKRSSRGNSSATCFIASKSLTSAVSDARARPTIGPLFCIG